MNPSTTRLIAAVCGIALLLAVLPLPYGYYQVLRWTICLAAAVLGASRWNQAPYSGSALILVAIVFNPFIPTILDRSSWLLIDIAGAALFGWIAFRPQPNAKP